MPYTREEAIEKLMAHYQEPYLCARRMDDASPLAATACMHLVSDRELLSLANVGIVDAAGNYISALSDYVCYTCQDNWNNVSVAGFRILDEDYVI